MLLWQLSELVLKVVADLDRWPFDQGENAAVVKVEDWYIKDRV